MKSPSIPVQPGEVAMPDEIDGVGPAIVVRRIVRSHVAWFAPRIGVPGSAAGGE